MPTERLEKFEAICKDMAIQYEAKNHDYGNSFEETVNKLGIIAATTRLYDKMNRIVTLTTGKDRMVSDESLEDTLMDLATYCVMTVMVLEVRGRDQD